jgi:hypothetical protein
VPLVQRDAAISSPPLSAHQADVDLRERGVHNSTASNSGKRPAQLNSQYNCRVKCRDSAVGIATGYGLDDRGVRVRVPVGARIFTSPRRHRPALGPTQPPIQWVRESLSPGVKRPGREADHSPPTSAEVKKTWVYTSTPPYVFMA